MTPRDLVDAALTDAVVHSFAGAESERFKTVITSLVRHLHAFASEVELTEEEWFAGIDFLTRTGHTTDDKRQEFILLSDVLGLSMLVVGLNHRQPPEATESTVFGPFFVEGSPAFANGDDIAQGAPGEPCLMQGRVIGVDGEPVAGADIEVWQADEDGFYDVQYADLDAARGRRHGGLAGGRGWVLRLPARRLGRPPRAGPSRLGPGRALLVLVGQAGGVPDPGGRPRGRPAGGRGPRADAPGARALQGRRRGV